ncbi:MAG: PAS domain S-box protein [Smithellaceae bacterium]|nr:PAS domain S-box protein [Smithellaceae bacterium]
MTSASARPNKNADEEAGASAFLQKLIDSIPLPIFYKDIRGRYLGGNRAFADFLGRKMEDIVGKTVQEIAPADLAEEYERADKELFQSEGIQTCESAIVHADGTRHKVIFHQATFSNRDGVVSGLVGSLFDITWRQEDEETLRQREEELAIKSRNLQEVNTALKVLLKQREEDRKELEENVLANVKTSLLPHIEKLKGGPLTEQQRTCLEILEAQTKKIISPFLNRISQTCFDLTPQEIRVADFVKNGNTTKEIAGILGISLKTVAYHRDNIRRKLGIKNHQTNLRAFLFKLS